jgi:hypothetical protein
VEDLYQETRELSQRLQDSESELKSSDLQLKLKEEEKRKELEVMREHYQRKVEEAMKKGSVDSSVVEGTKDRRPDGIRSASSYKSSCHSCRSKCWRISTCMRLC